MAQPTRFLHCCFLLAAAGLLPGGALAVQTQQSGLIRSVVLDAPRDQAVLINALAGLRGKLLTPGLRASTHQGLKTAVERLGWTNVQITLPAKLPGSGRWLVTVAGDPPRPANRAVVRTATPTPAAIGAPAQDLAAASPRSPTLEAWVNDPHSQVLIVRGAHQLYAKLGGVIERFPVAVGRRSNPTPLGHYAVQNIAHKPTWYPTKRMRAVAEQRGRTLPKRVPPGPGNPLGDWFVALGRSIGIHGNNSPWSIGRSVSSGCIRMRNADIERLARSLVAGDGVQVVDALESPKPVQASTPSQTVASGASYPPAGPRGLGISLGPASP